MRILIHPRNKGVDDEGFWEDVEEGRRIIPVSAPNWYSGPPAPGEAIPETPGAIVMGRARPEPEPVKEAKSEPEPVKETLRERFRRLKAEVNNLEQK